LFELVVAFRSSSFCRFESLDLLLFVQQRIQSVLRGAKEGNGARSSKVAIDVIFTLLVCLFSNS
jgi:hypothetical protein